MIGEKLIAWYEKNKRDLPWRNTADPYLIWVSEIILQQTRVAQGLDYYRRFTAAYPTISALASADIDSILKLWQGLGYYSRARNMHTAARHIIAAHGGNFPHTAAALITIKGIGAYTAAAIASFAFGEAVPVIDGNVNRVIARLQGIDQPVNKPAGQALIRAAALQLLVRSAPAAYNQAIMEFGALQCTPQKPRCNTCILHRICTAHGSGLTDVLPVKIKTAKITVRHLHYLHVRMAGDTFVQQRTAGDIWEGLYEFPLIETVEETSPDNLCHTPAWHAYFAGQTPCIHTVTCEITRRLTHRILKIKFYGITVVRPLCGAGLLQIPEASIHQRAVPQVINNYLNSLNAPRLI